MSTSRKPARYLDYLGRCAATGKSAFGSRKQAKRAARWAKGHRMQAYACDHCGGWHYGHIPDDVRNGTWDKDDWLRRTR